MPLPRARLAVPLVTALVALGAGPLSGEPSPAPPSPVLPRLVAEGHAPAAAMLSASPSGSQFQTAGHGIRRADRFRAGSITKTFVATVVLQLDAEGRLDLDDPVGRHLPGLVRGEAARRVTLRALLTHTSGLPDYAPGTTHASPPARTSAREAVRRVLAGPWRPVGHYAYSNTNYVLLGLVIEHVTDRPYATEALRRIIRPLRLTGTSFPGTRAALPSPHGRAYDAAGRDVTVLDPRTADAAGELVSTLDDLNRFYAALLSGRLLPPPQLRELLSTRPASGPYGMGIYRHTLSCGTTVWGHNGLITGSYVRSATSPDGRRTVTFRVNTDAVPRGTLAELEPALLDAEFCRGAQGRRGHETARPAAFRAS
ncbi:class A beta-lactamase-related serine hydrolase [Streptomyces sp. WAC05374]|uniref:serine hydrolase domain-containing protein n=1 Tax=Streptomyces sp. WAC05374 TaxID=2487420 RepID=UPI001054C3B6|nr:serine hydrolase domain-containing protein [Streptomyces sp. WAC05374]TDF37044.1 class A beta-lactamase-related serine hydrolase [Streptomyces sp. WAC05374]TDF45058.1 class A beta-lactamase-related serine hydrolase [Streptomyces sp. WAC05374]TDF46373.1 class A beta-lactamase-related serine hydrolase [Streptomyces sp. WAC05374]